MHTDINIGVLIEEFKQRHKLKDEEIADILGISRGSISLYRKGANCHIDSYRTYVQRMKDYENNQNDMNIINEPSTPYGIPNPIIELKEIIEQQKSHIKSQEKLITSQEKIIFTLEHHNEKLAISSK